MSSAGCMMLQKDNKSNLVDTVIKKDNAHKQEGNFKLIWNRVGAWSHCRGACRHRKAMRVGNWDQIPFPAWEWD